MFSSWDEYRLINRGIAELADQLPRSALGDAVGYILSSPGKRVRPLILISSSQAFGCDPLMAVDASLAVEMVHAASLVHDDILDWGVERRGMPSAFERYGDEIAILSGDYMISRSIDLISSYSQRVIKAFSGACMDMAEGEILDLTEVSSPEEYYSCIYRKTASLFEASAEIGCLIACAPEEDVARFKRYGSSLGLAYQILDDLEEYLGVSQGKESSKTSMTLPRIYGDMLSPEKSLEMCSKAIRDYCAEAKKALEESSGKGQALSRLQEIVDYMTQRGLEECRSLKSLC